MLRLRYAVPPARLLCLPLAVCARSGVAVAWLASLCLWLSAAGGCGGDSDAKGGAAALVLPGCPSPATACTPGGGFNQCCAGGRQHDFYCPGPGDARYEAVHASLWVDENTVAHSSCTDTPASDAGSLAADGSPVTDGSPVSTTDALTDVLGPVDDKPAGTLLPACPVAGTVCVPEATQGFAVCCGADLFEHYFYCPGPGDFRYSSKTGATWSDEATRGGIHCGVSGR